MFWQFPRSQVQKYSLTLPIEILVYRVRDTGWVSKKILPIKGHLDRSFSSISHQNQITPVEKAFLSLFRPIAIDALFGLIFVVSLESLTRFPSLIPIL